MRIVVALLSLLGFVAYCAVLNYGMSGGAFAGGLSGVSFVGLAFFSPLAYFLVCFCTAFARRRGRFLLAVGVFAHALMAALVVAIAIGASVEGAAPFAIGVLFYGGMWFFMFHGLRDANTA